MFPLSSLPTIGAKLLAPPIAKANIRVKVKLSLPVITKPKKFRDAKRYHAAISVSLKRVRIRGVTESRLSD
jgi:hypothetical protein